MDIRNLIFNKIEYTRSYEIHLTKDEIIERLLFLTEDIYEGKIEADRFKLTPISKLFNKHSYPNTNISGEFENEEIPYILNVTVKRNPGFVVLTVLFDIFSVLSILVIGSSEMEIQGRLIFFFILLMIPIAMRNSFNEQVKNSELVFLGYLSRLFKPIELRIK